MNTKEVSPEGVVHSLKPAVPPLVCMNEYTIRLQ
jgi:hypothetical protein